MAEINNIQNKITPAYTNKIKNNEYSSKTSFCGNKLEKSPEQDKADLKKAAKEFGFAALISATGLALVDIIGFKGRHIKRIFHKLPETPKKTQTEYSPARKTPVTDTPSAKNNFEKETEEYFKAEEEAAQKAKRRIAQSDARNEEWVNFQHEIKEEEYSDFWNKALKEKEANEIRTIKTAYGTETRQGNRLISRTYKDKEGYDVTVKYSADGKEISEFSTNGYTKELKLLDPDGYEKVTYFLGSGGLSVEKGNKGYIAISSVALSEFDEAVKFVQKYENATLPELEKLYKQVLSGNPQKMSELEFQAIEGQIGIRTVNCPETSRATHIQRHHMISVSNPAYRNNSGKLEGHGKTEREFTKDEWAQLSDKDKDFAYNNSTYKDMLQIDRQFNTLSPLEKDCIFYRGVGKKYIPTLINGKIGDIVVPDKAYAYTAFNRVLASGFGNGTMLTIHTPKGAKISRNLEHGGEALFPRNAQYKLLSKGQTPDGNWRIELEYILPKKA